MFKVKIHIMLKDDVLDPQGKTVNNALEHLNYKGVSNTRIGKYIEFMLDTDTEKKAKQQAEEMCKRILANVVIEKYEFFIERISE